MSKLTELEVTVTANPKLRRVIQVSSQIDSVGKYFILAVCNDGTLWKLDGLYEGDPSWEPFTEPPQP